MEWTLQITDHRSGEASKYAVEKHTVSIGRDETQDVVIMNPSVSRAHVILEVQDGKAYLEDLDSSNGTYIRVNGILLRCDKNTQIPLPAELMLGNDVTCSVTHSGVAARPSSGELSCGTDKENPSLVLSIKRLAKKQAIMVLDLCNSTRLSAEDEQAAFHSKRRVDEFARKVLFEHGTQFYKNTGDGFVAAFAAPSEALAASRELLELIKERNRTTRNAPIHIRVALHYGTTYLIDPETQDIHGKDVNTAFRIEGVTRGNFKELTKLPPPVDRILCSGAFVAQLGETGKARTVLCGKVLLKGVSGLTEVYLIPT